jgi:hypothetical protein
MDIEAGLPPRQDQLDYFLSDFPFSQEHLEDRVLEDIFQMPRVPCRGYLEPPVSIENSIGAKHMAVGVEVQGIAEGLDGNDGAGDCILFGDTVLGKTFQRIPCAATQIGEKVSIIEEVTPQDLW